MSQTKAWIFPRYGRIGASSRLRMFQYEPYIRERGIESTIKQLFTDEYISNLYKGKRSSTNVATSLANRLAQLYLCRHADLLWVEKEALPWIPWAFESLALPRGVPLAVDYDDAIFHSYDLNSSRAIRCLLKAKIDNLMKYSSLVTAGNSYLASRALAAGARWVEIVPTVVDLNNYKVRQRWSPEAGLRIGWIGTPTTWTEYMAPMVPILTEVAVEEGARLTAIGAGQAAKPHPVLDVLKWDEAREVELIQDIDIGIMPLSDTPWARGKCGYKLIQYMACGLPIVASPVGVNAEMVENGVNGFLATTESEWREALSTLLRDPILRREMGMRGRRKVEMHYSLELWGPRVADMLKKCAEKDN